MARIRDVGAFLVFGAIGCTVISATIGVSSLYFTGELGGSGFGLIWLIWWLGDLARYFAETGRNRCLLTAPPLRLLSGTGRTQAEDHP